MPWVWLCACILPSQWLLFIDYSMICHGFVAVIHWNLFFPPGWEVVFIIIVDLDLWWEWYFFTIACVLVVVDSFSLAERTSFSMMIVKLTEDGCDGDCDNDDADVDDYDCDYDYDKADGDGDTYFHNDGKSKNPFKDHSQSLKQWYNVVRIPAPTVFRCLGQVLIVRIPFLGLHQWLDPSPHFLGQSQATFHMFNERTHHGG